MTAILFRKDLAHHGRELAFLIVCELIMLLSLAAQVDRLTPDMLLTLAFAISFVAGFVFSFRTIASEDGANGMGFLLSLPLTRQQIVLAKFAVNWVISVINFLLVWGTVLAYCIYRDGVDVPAAYLIVTGLLLQLLNSSFYLSCAILFNSARAIWIPFPLLVLAINVAINWDKIAVRLPAAPAIPGLAPLALVACSLGLLALTLRVFGRTAVRHEWI